MSLKFSCNISTLFTEYPLLERFRHAKEFGFSHVEMHSPYEYEPEDFNLHGLKVDLLNAKYEPNSNGYAANPVGLVDFLRGLNSAINYFKVFDFKKVHMLSGDNMKQFTKEQQFNAFVSTLNQEATQEFLDEYCLVGLIEPICSEEKENYFLSSFDMAVKVIEAAENKRVKLLLDVYHLHKITGDVKSNLEKYYPYAGHIQISQDPGRVEPFYPGGKIDYDFVFKFLQDQGHQDCIGLEYSPSGSTLDSLSWLERYM